MKKIFIMEKKLPLLQDADLKDKLVLVRVDHNVVKSGIIQDSYRIDCSIDTLRYILSKGGKPIIMTHIGRPKDKTTGEILISDKTSVKPIVKYLQEKFNINIETPDFCDTEVEDYQCFETRVRELIDRLKEDEIQAVYLPNTRWFIGEEGTDEEKDVFARKLASLADVYVNDAFGSWQSHASTVGINKYLPSYAGLLMQKEIINLEKIYNAQSPFVAVVAGSKFDTKIRPLNALIKKADYLVLGGVMYNAYLCAKYDISIKGVGQDDIKLASEFYEYSKNFPNKIVELPFIIESDILDGKIDGQFRVIDIRTLKPKTELNYVLDVAPESFAVESVKKIFAEAKTIFVNAVMGFTPNFAEGTIALDLIISKNNSCLKLFGGGDTLLELKTLLPEVYAKAVDSPDYYMFTGGGSVLKAIEENSHLGIAPIKELINTRP